MRAGISIKRRRLDVIRKHTVQICRFHIQLRLVHIVVHRNVDEHMSGSEQKDWGIGLIKVFF